MAQQCFKEHFKFADAGEMFQASIKHTNRHKAVLTKDDRNILDLIRFYTAWHGAANLTYELLKSTGRCLSTIHCAIRKLIKLGIIRECYSEIDGIPTVLYTMQPFEEDSVGAWSRFSRPVQSKRYQVLEQFRIQ
ncbi:hypothetical protein [Sporosarcina sp. UB5]|uniref:hypothetical protein n=1 Tax=Sporosarcina sp. UB5 TaxID=3047463 RepID=UPI003D7BFB19